MPFFQPENVGDAKIFAEDLRVVSLVKPGFLSCTLLSRHSSVVSSVPRPLTSMLPPSRTTRRPWCSGCQIRALQLLIGFGDDCGVFLVIRIFGPAVEKQNCCRHFQPDSFRTQMGPESAHPSAIGGHVEEIEGNRDWRPDFSTCLERAIPRRGSREKIHALHLRQVAGRFSERPRDGRQFSGPVRQLVGPAQPCGFVGFPIPRACGSRERRESTYFEF